MRRVFARLYLTLTLALTLFGCMVGPNYQRPQVDIPQTWRFEDKEAKDVANTAWWEQFNDPVLDDLIQVALRENRDVQIAAARVEQFAGLYGTTRAALFPQVGAGALYGRQRISELTGPSPLKTPRGVTQPSIVPSFPSMPPGRSIFGAS